MDKISLTELSYFDSIHCFLMDINYWRCQLKSNTLLVVLHHSVCSYSISRFISKIKCLCTFLGIWSLVKHSSSYSSIV